MKRTFGLGVMTWTGLVLAACGGGHPPADAPVAQAGAQPASPASGVPANSATVEPSTPATATVSSAAPSAVANPPPEAPAAAPVPTPARHVVDDLTAPNIAFTIDYSNSGPKQTAEKTCASKGDDPQARATCMEKERARFLADVVVFSKEPSGFFMIIYRRNGNALSEVSRSSVDFKNETGSNVEVHVKSDKGWRPLFAGTKTIAVAAPPESSNIELEDPVLGKLVYEAKIGLVDK